jgi:hypothetical protein
MGVRDRRAVRPVLERFEERQLLSGIIASMIASQPPEPSAISLLDREMAASATGSGSTTSGATTQGAFAGFQANSGNTGGVGIANGLNDNPNTPLLGNGFPTPQELARETFRATFTGRVYTGPGRFTDQGTTYFFRGLGGSTFFLHGDFDMAVVTPTDPSTNFLGLAVLNDKSTNSSGIAGFDLTASRTAVDSQGRPTQLTFGADPNIYSGIFYVEAAQGTVTITYGAKNAVKVTFQGLVYTTGLTSPLVNQDLYARNGRPIPFHPTNNLSKIHNG